MNLIKYIIDSNQSQEKLAIKSGLPLKTIKAILNGQEPSLADLKKISKALRLSLDFFLKDENGDSELKLLFRKSFSENNVKADRFSYMVSNSFSILSGQHYNYSWINSYSEFVDNTYENAEKLAQKFRQDFFSGDFYSPLLNLPKIIDEKLGCILYISEFGSDIDGASAIISDVPYIFISPRFEPRMLYTLAHELGHILAHHKKDENFVKFDKHISVRDRTADEAFCNAFASSLLLPIEGLSTTIKKLRDHYKNTGPIGDIEILYLSRIYGVSFEVAARRCEDLDLLPSGGANSLYQELKRIYGSPEKRASEAGLPPRFEITFPKVSSKLINAALEKINKGEISLGRVAEILSVPIPVILSKNASRVR